MNLFDLAESQRRKDDGIQLASDNEPTGLCLARSVARKIAQSNNGLCHADQVGEWFVRNNQPSLGPASGAIFKGAEWIFTGDRIKSARVSNHARELKIWRLLA